jgi:hypothetical protein
MGFDLHAIDVHFIPGSFKIAEFEARIREEAEALGGVTLVIVDTSAAYFDGDNENDNVQSRGHALQLRSLVTLPGGPCVIVNCHPIKHATMDNLLPRGGGAFVAEMDGNLVCLKGEDAVKLHWQCKFRGPDFEPIPFELRSVQAACLKDSKGRPIPTVIAAPLSKAEQVERASAARSNEDEVLVLLSKHGSLSPDAVARHLGWLSPKGEPQKSKTWRVLDGLRKERLVTKERGNTTLTEKGKAAAKKAEYNAQTVGATYG